MTIFLFFASLILCFNWMVVVIDTLSYAHMATKALIEKARISYAAQGLLEYTEFLVAKEKAFPDTYYAYQDGTIHITKQGNNSQLKANITVFRKNGLHSLYVKNPIDKKGKRTQERW